jgi:hypothetical protein
MAGRLRCTGIGRPHHLSVVKTYGPLRPQPKSSVAHNLNPICKMQLEGRVTDNSRAVAATITGAVIGGVAGYFFFTERGRELRRQIEPALDDFAREFNSFRMTIERAAGVANQGWKLLNEAMDTGPENTRYSTAHQTSPF